MRTDRITRIKYPALCFLAFILVSCAGQVAPSGGPVDTVPPEIIATVPLTGALQVTDPVIRLRFSKYVDRRSVQESIFISPSTGAPKLEWGGTDLEIRLGDSLRARTTYILTIGTDVVDIRNRNHLARAFALPFSTGDHIDSASIAGRVFDSNPQGTLIVGYRLDDIVPDTLNPTHTRPDFLTQTGKEGTFLLPFLPPGTYRLFALRDVFKNLTYDIQTDRFGVLPLDVTLTNDRRTITGLRFLLTGQDTVAPFLSSARAIDRNRVLLRFSEPMELQMDSPDSFAIVDTITGKPLIVFNASFVDTSGLEAQIVTQAQDSSVTYRVTSALLRDRQGNPMQAGQRTSVFGGSAAADTSKLSVTLSLDHDSLRNIPADYHITVRFGKPVERRPAEAGISLIDSSGTRIPLGMTWMGSSLLTLRPAAQLAFGSWYRFLLRLDSVKDGSGNLWRDTSLHRTFRTIETRYLGSIEGSVDTLARSPGSAGAGKIHLVLQGIGNEEAVLREESMERPGPFGFMNLLEGKYLLFAYRDSDGDGKFSFGLPYPYRPSEEFVVYPDTLKVRARWPLDGVKVTFGE